MIAKYIREIIDMVTDNLFLSYLIAVIVGSSIFLVEMVLYDWDISNFIGLTLLLIPTAISGVSMRFLSGLGLIITYATISSFLFRIFARLIKGRKTSGQIFKAVVLGIVAVIAGYGGYVLITTLLFSRSLSFIEDWLSLLIGVWSLIILVYLVPLIKAQYRPLEEDGLKDKIVGKLGGLKYSVWRRYKSRIRKDYGKVYATEYERYKINIEDIRDQLSGLLLLPFMVILIAFPPLMACAIILWIRVFSHNEKPFTLLERILFVFVLGGILFIATLLFLFVDITVLVTYFNIAYAMGIFSGIGVLTYVIIKS